MHLIFDFDGTLLDSYESAIQILNQLAEEFHFRKIPREEADQLKDLSSLEFVRFLKLPFYKIPQVLLRARKIMHEQILSLHPFPDLPDILNKLHEQKMTLGILTSNSVENVSAWLKHHHLNHLFQFIHSEKNYFGKKHVLKKIISRYNIDKIQTFYIGDETRDIEAANQNQIHSIAVTWGFNSEKVLVEHQPSFIARKPADLIDILWKHK